MARPLGRRSFTRGLGRALAVGLAAPVLGVAGRARAAEVTAQIELSADTTRVGEAVRLTMSLESRGAPVPARLPWPDALAGNFEISNVTNAGGSSRDLFGGPAGAVYSRRVSAIITPLVEGKFELGFAVKVDGETVESNVPVLEVLPSDAELPGPPPGSTPTEAQGPVFLWAVVDKKEAYVGEQLTYALDVYERRSFLGIHLRKPPSFTDFFTEELDEGEPRVETVGGIDYRVRPGLRRALFPQRAGTLQIGAAELSVGGRQRILSPAIDIEVKPLPGQGRPPGFSANNVGRFSIVASVDRDRVAANEPITLTVTIEGEGNVKFVDPGPWPEMNGLRRYDPKVETRLRKGSRGMGGQRRYEFLLIPEHGGELTIPAHELAYFDPDQERYAVARTEPITIEVTGGETVVAEPEPEPEPESEEIAPLFAESTLPRHTPRERWLSPSRWTYGMVAVPVLAAAGLGGAALWRRYGPDEQVLARARRKQRHRGLIDAAEQAVESGDGFHAALAKLLQEIAVDRAGSEGVGLPRPELLRLLGQQGVPPGDVERLRGLLDRCDEARFASQRGTRDDRQALLEEVLDLMRTSELAKEGT
ncbi:MAG: protein BatD [Myxococcales bacterium]|nr:protein BatD [Myxococcales bacterium]